MVLSDDAISKFQAIYKTRFGRQISRKDALEKGVRLLRLVALVYKPMTEGEFNQLQDRRKQTGETSNNC
jgi:hypothetical protein